MKYTTMYDEPLTIKQASPDYGYHFLFYEKNLL